MKIAATALVALLLAPQSAFAHTGVEHAMSFGAGFAHPWSGLDHILAMVAVGLWAGLKGGRAIWAWPASFVSVMSLGGTLGMIGIPLPAVESGILASVIVLGVLVLAAARPPVLVGAALIGAFALLHGHAHGAELPSAGAAVSYALGFAAATALLHTIGLAVALVGSGESGRQLVRGTGALMAVAGVALAVL
jgi:urease accessory protein